MDEFALAGTDFGQADAIDFLFDPGKDRIGGRLVLNHHGKPEFGPLPQIVRTDLRRRDGEPLAAAAENFPHDPTFFFQILRGMKNQVEFGNTDNHRGPRASALKEKTPDGKHEGVPKSSAYLW